MGIISSCVWGEFLLLCVYIPYIFTAKTHVSYVFHVLGLCEKCVLCILCVSRVNDVMYFV